MQISRLAYAAIAALLLNAQAASAFSQDDRTLNQPSGAPRFSDPDEQTPTPLFSIHGQSNNFGDPNSNNDNNPSNYSTTAAPFSPATGMPRH